MYYFFIFCSSNKLCKKIIILKQIVFIKWRLENFKCLKKVHKYKTKAILL